MSGEDGASDPGVLLVSDHLDPGVTYRSRRLAGGVRAGVVDHDNVIHQRGSAPDDLVNMPLLKVGRHDDGDPLPRVHVLKPPPGCFVREPSGILTQARGLLLAPFAASDVAAPLEFRDVFGNHVQHRIGLASHPIGGDDLTSAGRGSSC